MSLHTSGASIFHDPRMYLTSPCSSPVGVSPKPENCVFVPVPVELRFHDAERSGSTHHHAVE